jgi:hypothetical protein
MRAHPWRASEARHRGQPSNGRKVHGATSGTPSPTWRSFLSNEAIGIAIIDMFVAVSVSFRLLYVMIILAPVARDCNPSRITNECFLEPSRSDAARQEADVETTDEIIQEPACTPRVSGGIGLTHRAATVARSRSGASVTLPARGSAESAHGLQTPRPPPYGMPRVVDYHWVRTRV